MTAQAQQPLIILGSPRSFTSLICAMLGQHPQAYGMPELNLFITDTLREMVDELSGYRQIQLHGLMRVVGHLYAGEQTMASVDMARRWILGRLSKRTTDIYYELCERVGPLRIVDKSPVYSLKREYLERLGEAFPDAYYLHLVRHPLTQGESIMKVAKGLMAILADSIDYDVEPPQVDPQISWFNMQENILDFLDHIPAERQLRLRGEEVLNDRRNGLSEICRWIGIKDSDTAIEAMMHPEESPFACLGPLGAHLGNDINFLRSPALRDGSIRLGDLDVELPWRNDGRGFNPEVVEMALELGYT
ncbi:MAG TPA: sulfotransferase [Chromatiaceae bacterium]|nr:sulfotransferase [Chromatiaceae bacterium]HIA07809.1 sulfotransferase [Chromatiaceae bacterium]HIN81566.1 sulfotransferase [Chromatiales bacterium]HIO13569.1 sulfotransferase [Chromatiales bacterium]